MKSLGPMIPAFSIPLSVKRTASNVPRSHHLRRWSSLDASSPVQSLCKKSFALLFTQKISKHRHILFVGERKGLVGDLQTVAAAQSELQTPALPAVRTCVISAVL